MKYFSILFLCLSGCAHVSEYYRGCVDGVGGMKYMLKTEIMGEPDMVDYYCKVVERNREQKESHK